MLKKKRSSQIILFLHIIEIVTEKIEMSVCHQNIFKVQKYFEHLDLFQLWQPIPLQISVSLIQSFIFSGKNKPDCDHCLDNPRKKCKHCACCVCGGKHDPDKQILCDECDQAYHLGCLKPPLTSIPDDDEW